MQQHVRGPRPAAFGLCPPGAGQLLLREARARGMRAGSVSNDGRADLVAISPPKWHDLQSLRLPETICADVGQVRLVASVQATAAQITGRRLSSALAELRRAGLISRAPRLRLVVRLQNEQGFSRSALRQEVARHLRAPITRGHEEATELWILQDTRHSLRVGLRIPTLETARAPRRVERPGALRSSLAAAMVSLGGDRGGRLLDPCCGSGSILAEARLAGWTAVGGDLANDATAAATLNAPGGVLRLDSRQLPFRDDEFDAVVSNLPFGYQYEVQGAPVAWYRRTLSEATRVAPRVIVLAPASTPFRQALGRMKVALRERHDIEILGRASTIWVVDRGSKTR